MNTPLPAASPEALPVDRQLPEGLIADLRAKHAAATAALGGRDIYAPLATFNGKIEAYAPSLFSNKGCRDVCQMPEFEDAEEHAPIFDYLATAANFLPHLCDAVDTKDAQLAEKDGHIAELRAALEGLIQNEIELEESGDAGSWDVEAQPHIKEARAALAVTNPEEVKS